VRYRINHPAAALPTVKPVLQIMPAVIIITAPLGLMTNTRIGFAKPTLKSGGVLLFQLSLIKQTFRGKL
jgi:hypothetical protein